MSKIKHTLNTIKNHTSVFSFLSGLLFAIPFIWGWLFPFTFLSLALFFYSLKQREKKGCFKPFFLFFSGVYAIVYTLFFKLYPFEGFTFSNTVGIIIVIFAWIFASLIHSTMGGIVLGLSKFFKNNSIKFALCTSSLWVIYEWTLTLGDLAFPWVTVSVGLIKFLPFLQTASLFGNGFITFITVFSCCLIGSYLSELTEDTETDIKAENKSATTEGNEYGTNAESKSKNKKSLLIKIPSAILILNFIMGTVLYFIPENREEEKAVCIIQGNVSMGEKWNSENLVPIVEQHKELMISHLEKQSFDIVLLAETVFPALYTEKGYIYNTLSKIAKDYNTTIIFGVLLPAANEKKYNAMMAIYPDGTTSEPYYKQRLVPFGEKNPDVPIIKSLPILQNLNIAASFVSGTECKNIVSFDGTVFGPAVCYDSVFPQYARENVLNGAEILAVSTNDSWYKDGVAVIHHQSQSALRAIETGRYVIRAANTGISCIINSKGNILAECGIMNEEVLCGVAHTSNSKTLYVILGNTSLYLSFGIVLAFFIIEAVSFIRKKVNKTCLHKTEY